MKEPQPILVKRNIAPAAPESAERMQITIADSAPVLEVDSEFECGTRARHELGFVDAQAFVEGANVWQRCLTYANNSDFFGFD